MADAADTSRMPYQLPFPAEAAEKVLVSCHDLLRASRGAPLATASMLSYVGGPRVPGYAASKGGIVALALFLCSDAARFVDGGYLAA